jgi:hypothetical protein
MCAATNGKGQPCGHHAEHGTPFCSKHSSAVGAVKLNLRTESLPHGGRPGCTSNNIGGIYLSGLRVEEAANWDGIKNGTLDAEMRLARCQLRRVLQLQLKREEAQTEDEREAALDLQSVEKEIVTGTGPDGRRFGSMRRHVTRRGRDYTAEIIQFTRLIAVLERSQAILNQLSRGEDEYAKISRAMRGFGDEAIATLPGGEI